MHTDKAGNKFLVGVVRDITDRKRMEDELRHARDDLELRVRERTKELVNANEALQSEIAQRKSAEEKLFAERQKFQTLSENSPFGIVLIEKDGNFSYINPEFKEMFGYDLNDVSSEREWFQKAYPDPAYRNEVKSAWINDLSDLQPAQKITRTFTVTCKDGTEKIIKFILVQHDANDYKYQVSFEDITKRKLAEQELRASLQFLETLIDTIPSPVFYKDRKGIYKGCNKKFAEQILGLSRAEIVGRSIYDLNSLNGTIPHDLADVYHSQDEKLIRRGGVQVYESEVQCADGKRREFRFNKATFTDAADNIAGLIGVMVDVTDHKRIEETLRLSEEKYRELVENVSDTIYSINELGELTYISPTVGLLAGYTPSELVGRNFSELVHQEDLPAVREAVQRTFSGKVESLEFRVLAKSGEILWLQASGRPIFTDGRIAGLRGVLTNITKRKAAEAALNESEERYHAVIEQASESIFLFDAHTGRILESNIAFQDLLGYSSEEFLGQKIYDIDLHDRKDIDVNIQNTLTRRRHLVGERLYSRKDGSIIEVEVGAAAIVYAGKEVICVVARDITERKRAEKALRKSEQEKAAILSGLKRVAVQYLDPEMRIIWVNNAVQKFTDLSEEEVRGKHCFELLHGRKEPCVGCTAFKALKTGQSEEGELVTPDGKIWISRSSPLMDENGTVIGVVHAAVNITENRRAERDLHRKERQQSALLNSIPDMAWLKDRDSRYIAVNESFGRACGFRPEDLTGKTDLDIWPGLAEGYGREDREVMDTRKQMRVCELFVDKCGKESWIENIIAPILDGGEVIGTAGISRDITEHKRMEDALKESERRLADIIDFLPDATLVIDREGRVIAWNRAMEELTGVAKRDILGKGGYAYSVPFYGEPRPILIDLIYTNDPDIESQYAYIERKEDTIYAEGIAPFLFDGKDVYLWSTASPLLDSKGNMVGAIESIRNITQRRMAEQALIRSEERYRTLIETTNTGYVVLDLQGSVVDANAEYIKLSGHNSLEDIFGRSIIEWTAPYDLERNHEELRRCAINGFVRDLIIDYVDRKGIVTPIEINATVVTTDEGPRIICLCRDITDRRQKDQQLREAEAKYRLLIEQIPAVTYTAALDNSCTTLYISPQVASMLGFTQAEYTAEPDMWQRRLHPEDCERVLAEFTSQFSSCQPIVSEYRMIAKDGRVVWFRDEAVVVRDNAGAPLHLQGVMFDITERKRTQEELRLERNKLKDILNAMVDGVVAVNQRYEIEYVNPVIEMVFGPVEGRKCYEYFHDRTEICSSCRNQEVFEGKAVRWERHNLKSNRIYDILDTPIRNADGSISKLGILRDITERKRSEETLQKAKEAAEAAARIKSEFLANMSHEIRTPLNAVIGMTGLLLDTPLSADQRECAETVRSSGDLLMAIINDILDFSKIEEGKRRLERQPFDLRSCIEGSIDLVGGIAAEKGLKLNYFVDSQVPASLIGDVTSLRQVLVNLLSNAVKFTDAGEVFVSVTSQPKPNSRFELHFEVRDTGIGIPQESMSSLFQSFRQVDMTTTRKYGGTGLGLAISKRLVELMEGRIWIESVMGKGSTFHFTILIDPAPLPVQAGSLDAQGQSGLQKDQLVTLRLLLAEDNMVNQKVALRMLGKLGIRADVAANGLEVLEALERQNYDIVLMDVQMPEMDGLEATRAIHERWPKGAPHIIAVTAHALEGDRERCLQAGMDDYISKPVKMEELVSALSRYQPIRQKNVADT